MRTCRCGHDQLLHNDLSGPCVRLEVAPNYRVGCGCNQYCPQPAPKVES